MSYSQLGQDLEVIKFYNKKENGFFIEIGASDGIIMSNTYLKHNINGKEFVVNLFLTTLKN